MALPNLQYRGDVVVMADWTATDGVGVTYTNWCGATGISLALTNNINDTTVADCDDWSLPAQVIRAYGAQSVTATVAASLTRAGRDNLIRAVLGQRELPLRFHLVGAEVPGAAPGANGFQDRVFHHKTSSRCSGFPRKPGLGAPTRRGAWRRPGAPFAPPRLPLTPEWWGI